MVDICIRIADEILFLGTGSMLIYLFVLAIASHRKHRFYAPSKKSYQCAILVPPESKLPSLYSKDEYDFIVYEDLTQTVKSLNPELYDIAIILSGTACRLSPGFLDKIRNTYDAGVQAIQLHTVVENPKGFKQRFSAIYAEMNNSFFKSGNSHFGLSTALEKTNVAIDLKWLQDNIRSNRTNLERKLLSQSVYIDYLPDAVVYNETIPDSAYRRRMSRTFSDLMPAFIENNWSFFNRIVQQLMPSLLKVCIFSGIWMLFTMGYDWTLSFKWWGLLFFLSITYSLSIPDYLVKKKNKRAHAWKKNHSNKK